MSEKQREPIQVSPRGTAAFAWVNKKDTKFAKGNPDKAKYKLQLVLDKGEKEHEDFVQRIIERHEKVGTAKPPVRDGDEEKYKKGENKGQPIAPGKYLIAFQSSYKPRQVDSKKRDLPTDTWVASGDEVKVAFTFYEYEGFGGGVSLRMQAVMLLAKNNVAGQAGVDAFGEEEGYDAFGETEGDVAPQDDESDF